MVDNPTSEPGVNNDGALTEATASNVYRELAAENSERLQVESYLADRLPSSEQRIASPQDPGCRVAMVIPAYTEGAGILRPLGSLAAQEGVTPEEFEVIIVVNRGETSPSRTTIESSNDFERRQRLFEKAKNENTRSLQIIAAIHARQLPPDLTESEITICQQIIASGIRVFAIDKSSDGQALPTSTASVGTARDRGVAEAIERFYARKQDGIIAQSDADTAFDKSYLANTIRAFEHNPDAVGIAGSTEHERTAEVEALFPPILQSLQTAYQGAWDRMLFSQLGVVAEQEAAQEVGFYGPSMASKAFVTARAGGVPHLSGGEDTAFGHALQSYGKIIKDPSLVAKPESRFSARTEVGAGHGQRLLTALDSLQSGGLTAPNPDAVMAYVQLRQVLGAHLGPAAKDMQAPQIDGQAVVDNDQLERLKLAATVCSDVDELLARPEIIDIKNAIQAEVDQLYKKIPIDAATTRLVELVINGDPQKLANFEEEFSRLAYIEQGYIAARTRLTHELFTHTAGLGEVQNNTVGDIVASLQEPLGLSDEQIQQIQRDKQLISNFAKIATNHKDVSEASSAMASLYPNELTPVDSNPVLRSLLMLQAISA